MSMFRRMMMKQGGGGSSVPGVKESEAGDICVYNVNKGSLAIIKAAEWSASKYPIAIYVPVGVVVVPASHGHYEGCKCAIVSLNHMNCDTPTTGGTAQYIRWGILNIDIDTLPNLNEVPYIGEGVVTDTVIGTSGTAYLPSDYHRFTAVTNPYDSETKYYYSGYYNYAPSPYNNDRTFNTNYSLIDSPSSTANCLSDFDGYDNTKKIIEVRGEKDYSSWTPSSGTSADYPAASCCDMYSTPGISQGNWYLPACGELGYSCVRRQTIDNSINKLIDNDVSSANVFASYTYWSSSKHSSGSSRCIGITSGSVSSNANDNDYCYVRAFALV